MQTTLSMTTLYDFLDDTCVFATVAFLITRGSWLRTASQKLTHQQILMRGLLFALIGTFQIISPEARFPYGPSTLVVIFATLVSGWKVGLVAGIGISTTGVLFHTSGAWARYPTVLISVLIAHYVATRSRITTRAILLAGILAQSFALGFRACFAHFHLAESFDLERYLITIPANAVGLFLLNLIVHDAHNAAAAEQLAHEAEQARRVATEATLVALRSRLNPHFLYNALSTIAALCRVAPLKAERAVIRLGTLLRKALELDPHHPIRLSEELEVARAYTEIEEYRFGSRLQFIWNIDETALSTPVPALALVTLIENAVTHGIGGRPGPGTVTITIRQGRFTLVAVSDNGIGLPTPTRSQLLSNQGSSPHGLAMVADEIRLLFGAPARIRLFSPPGCGTLAVLILPKSVVPC